MINENSIKKMLSKMTSNVHLNLCEICKVFERLNYIDEEEQSILHILTNEHYDEEKCFMAIQSLLEEGLSPNSVDYFKYNFIQTALYAGYSEKFILNIISESLKYDLNVNHVDEDGDTIMHTAIYSDDYTGNIEKIYELLFNNGFEPSIEDSVGRDIIEAMIYQSQLYGKYTNKEIESFKNKIIGNSENLNSETTIRETQSTVFNSPTQKPNDKKGILQLSDKDIAELEKYGKVLNNKNYITAPTIGREKELKNLMITLAQDKKRPLIVGESGVGKTAIVDELAYRIKTEQVPSFLQGKIILEVNPSDVVAGCQFVGMFEDNMTKLMNLCEKHNIIVFIDEIHTIYGIGSTKGKDNDMAAMLKHYIDRSNLKVIGATTEKEYNEFFGNDALKRRFEKVNVKEPTEEVLLQIINKVMEDYNIKNEIAFEDESSRKEIASIILDATKRSHRVYNDMVNNPDLSISVIDKAFAFAKVYDSKTITAEHFIESFEYCDRIYESSREQAISQLKNLNQTVTKPTQKILKLDFNKFKK